MRFMVATMAAVLLATAGQQAQASGRYVRETVVPAYGYAVPYRPVAYGRHHHHHHRYCPPTGHGRYIVQPVTYYSPAHGYGRYRETYSDHYSYSHSDSSGSIYIRF